MNIKPRSMSGHLLSVHGKKDYIVLEMINGTIKFLVKTQKGMIETSYEPPKPNFLCDGLWHHITGIKDIKLYDNLIFYKMYKDQFPTLYFNHFLN